ncbi:MAG: lipid-A-disaccharide synthase [Holosporaceae bacterium]|jgi:lipid-A-disaccharide synthase|nr:lipid-A-disaccharide synthase [Holosporaceae bacterium]
MAKLDYNIGIICGGGNYPKLIAQVCSENRRKFCLVFLKGFCDEKNYITAPSITVNFGEVAKTINFLRDNNAKQLIFAGKVERPDFGQLSLDKKGVSWIIKLGKSILAGDDALLRAIAKLFQDEGFEVIDGTSLLKNVFFSEGVFSSRNPSASDYENIEVGLKAARELGLNDIGQAVMVRTKKILGKEDIRGTDFLIDNCGRLSGKGGILIKVSKPQQDFRLDLPTIGVNTIEKIRQNGFDGIVVEAHKCIIINKEEVIRKANEAKVFLIAVKPIKKIFIIAGEASGDYLGSRLMKDILELCSGKVVFFGIGGRLMEESGLRVLFPIDKLSIIGVWEALKEIFRIKKLIKETILAICDYQPDAIVTIDSSGFTHRVAKGVKRKNKIPVVHYVSPPVWAWRPWRAKYMHKFLDKLMVLFPFETKYFHKLKTVFVGHPIATDPDFEKPSDSELQFFLSSICGITNKNDCKIITLLPGSRKSELSAHFPILAEFVRLAEKKYSNVKFIIPTIKNLEPFVVNCTKDWKQKPIIITDKTHKIFSYYSSDCAVAASGTVTLELARVALPFVSIYKTSRITYWIIRMLIRVSNICLVNILMGKKVVSELLQNDCTGPNIMREADKILDGKKAEKQKEFFREIISKITGKTQQAAKEVLNMIKRDNMSCDG